LEVVIDEQNLAERFARNDRKALETIYSRNFNSVQQYILKNNGSADDAADIFQEAIVAAWLNVSEGKYAVQSGNSLGGYIYQIAKNKWLDKLKSKAHKSTMRIEREDFVEAEEPDTNWELQEERHSKLKALYSKLDEKCRAILNKFYYEKKDLTTIGTELDYDQGTVKTLKYRCMKKLRTFHSKA
jgi:RNA polymerase sigma factor (sigma-70 family)